MTRSTIPPVTKLYLSILIFCSLLTFILRYSTYLHLVTAEEHNEDHAHLINEDPNDDMIPDPNEIYVPFITLVPSNLLLQLLFKPWSLLTTSLIENGIISFTITFGLILYTGRYIEVLWGSREFFRYLTIITVLSNTMVLALYNILRLINSSIPLIPISGSSAILIALLVAIKQRIPNHYLLFFGGSIRLGVSLLPFWMLSVSTLLSVFVPQVFLIPTSLLWSGFIISWTFLRFYKEGGSGRQLSLLPINEHEDNHFLNLKGDRTSKFALSTFFPHPISIFVRTISNKVFNIVVKFHLLNKSDFTDDDQEEENQEIIATANMTQNDLISSMSQSSIVTSSSLAGVYGDVPTFSFGRGTLLEKLFHLFKKKEVDDEVQKTLDKRRKMALMQLRQ